MEFFDISVMAEFVGGPRDGAELEVRSDCVRFSWAARRGKQSAGLFESEPEPSLIHGEYHLRRDSHGLGVRKGGRFLYDWKGWDKQP
jgi:hypothetical protein